MKKYIILVLIVLLIGALTVGVMGKAKVAHLYLYEKDSNWVIVDGGAWGKMKYNLSGETFDFVFNGHGLEPDEDYTLIYYADPWAAKKLCLGSGTANGGGEVHIANSVDTGTDLPADWDTPEYDGAKIWLVLTSDVDCVDGEGQMTGWTPAEYLFENDVITFDYTG